MPSITIEIQKNYFKYTDGKKQYKLHTIPVGTALAKEALEQFYANVFSFYFKDLKVENIKPHPWFVATPYQQGILFTYHNLIPDLLILEQLRDVAEKHLKTEMTATYVYKLPEFSLETLPIQPQNPEIIYGLSLGLVSNCYPICTSGFAILQEKKDQNRKFLTGLIPFDGKLNAVGKYLADHQHGFQAKFLVKTRSKNDHHKIIRSLQDHPTLSQIIILDPLSTEKANLALHCLMLLPTYVYAVYLKELLTEVLDRQVAHQITENMV